MDNKEYFNEMAQLLLEDAKSITQTKDSEGNVVTEYKWKNFDFQSFVDLLHKDEAYATSFSLPDAQKLLAIIVECNSWEELMDIEDEAELELKALFMSHFRDAKSLKMWIYFKETKPYKFLSSSEKLRMAQDFFNSNPTNYDVLLERLLWKRKNPSFSFEKTKNQKYRCKIEGTAISAEGESPSSALDNCIDKALSVYEKLYMMQFCSNTDAKSDLYTLERFGFITDLEVKLDEDDYEEMYYSEITCKRLFNEINVYQHEEEIEVEDDVAEETLDEIMNFED